jgi:hypothetical protein
MGMDWNSVLVFGTIMDGLLWYVPYFGSCCANMKNIVLESPEKMSKKQGREIFLVFY